MRTRNLFYLMISVSAGFLFSCSHPTENEGIYLSVSTSNQRLEIKNNTAEKIYYMAVESEFATKINWAPVQISDYVEPRSKSIINFSEIPNGSDENVKAGDRIIVYWWTRSSENIQVKSGSIVL